MRRRVLVTAAVTMLSLAVFAPASSAEPGPQRLAPQQISWKNCFQQSPNPDFPDFVRLQCAKIKVPLNWKKPNGKKITLAISRLPARQQATGTVFTNPGGPGAAGLFLPLVFIAADRTRVLDNMDVIGIDVRGTGYSTLASCKRVTGPYLEVRNRSTANTKLLLARGKKIATACQSSGNKKLPAKYVTTAQTVYDLEWIRRSLVTSDGAKVKQIHWVGYSGGTWLGAYYARRWPKRTGRFVLDSVADFSSSWETVFNAQPKGFHKRFGQFARWAARYKGVFRLGASQKTVIKRYERIRAGIAKRGRIKIYYTDGSSRWFYPANLDHDIAMLLYSKHDFPVLARNLKILSPLAVGAQARVQIKPLTRPLGPITGADPTFIDITCNDTPTKRSPAQHAAFTKKNGARYPLTGYAAVTDPCVHWKRPSGQLKIRRPAGRGLPRLLLIQSVLDPATPYGGAVKAHKAYQNSRLITVKNEGDHALYAGGNSCVDKVVERYLVDGVFPKSDGTCPGVSLPDPTARTRQQEQTNPLQSMYELDRLTGRS